MKSSKKLMQTKLLILFCFVLLFSPFLTAFGHGAEGTEETEENVGEESVSTSDEGLEMEESTEETTEEEVEINDEANSNAKGGEDTKPVTTKTQKRAIKSSASLQEVEAGVCGEEFTKPIDLRAELDLPSQRFGPMILENMNVIPGPDIELDVSHLVENPSDWSGAVRVDVNPDDHTIIIGVMDTSDYNDYEYVRVEIVTDEIGSINLINDKLFYDLPIDDYGIKDGMVYFEWNTDFAEDLTGETVFSYEIAPCPEYEITAQYVDEDGNKIAEDVTITGQLGSGYLLEPKHFDGYTLTALPDNYKGSFKEENDPVIFVYTKHVKPPMCPLEEVDVRVELGRGEDTKIFERIGVVPGEGFELDDGDLIRESEFMSGVLFVDIDPNLERIFITAESEAQMDLIRVEITTDQIESIKLLEDEMFKNYDNIDFSSGIENGVVFMEWSRDEPFMTLPPEMNAFISFGYDLIDCEEPPPLICPLEELNLYAEVWNMELPDEMNKYERLQVVPGVGPELTVSDAKGNHDYTPVDFEVDINPETKEITIITNEESWPLSDFIVKIETDQIISINEIENTLAKGDFDFNYRIEDGFIIFEWTTNESGNEEYFLFQSSGKAVFSFEQVDCEKPETPEEPEIPEEKEDPKKPIEIDEKEPPAGKPLPKTATPFYTFLFAGMLLVVLGGGVYFIYRKKQVM